LGLLQQLATEELRGTELRAVDVKERLANALVTLGDLNLTQGDPDAAWARYQQYIEVRRGKRYDTPKQVLVAAATGTAIGQLSVNFSTRLGEISFGLGDTETARGWFDRALNACRAAVDRDKNNAQAQLNLAGALGIIGDLELKQGSPAVAK